MRRKLKSLCRTTLENNVSATKIHIFVIGVQLDCWPKGLSGWAVLPGSSRHHIFAQITISKMLSLFRYVQNIVITRSLWTSVEGMLKSECAVCSPLYVWRKLISSIPGKFNWYYTKDGLRYGMIDFGATIFSRPRNERRWLCNKFPQLHLDHSDIHL